MRLLMARHASTFLMLCKESPMRLLTALITLLPSLGYAETHDVKMLTRGDTGAMVYEPAHLQIAPGDTVRFLPAQHGHNAASISEMLPEGAERFIGEIDEEKSVSFMAANTIPTKPTSAECISQPESGSMRMAT